MAEYQHHPVVSLVSDCLFAVPAGARAGVLPRQGAARPAHLGRHRRRHRHLRRRTRTRLRRRRILRHQEETGELIERPVRRRQFGNRGLDLIQSVIVLMRKLAEVQGENSGL